MICNFVHIGGPSRTILLLGTVTCVLFAPACSDDPVAPDDGGTPVSGQIVYSRNRNGAGQIIPVLAESGSGFDSDQVDSPAIAIDGSRPNGDKFLLYYEADGSQGVVIGVVSSDEEDMVPLVIGRTLAVGLGAPGSAYSFAATDPTVVVDRRVGQESARYKMWFEGRGGTGGATSTILYGTSADGTSWSAFSPCTGLGATFAAVRVADPTVVLDGDTYKMWFEAINTSAGGADGPGRVGYAESADGVAWVVRDAVGNTGAAAAAVFTPDASGFDAYSVNAPSVVLDASSASARFKMWYEAGNASGNVENTIGYATSANGLTWTRSSLPVLAPSGDSIVPLPFDSGDLEQPMAAIDSSFPVGTLGHFLLWYAADSEGSVTPNRIGLATGRAP